MPITEVDFLDREWRCLLLRSHEGNTMLTNGRHEISLLVTPKYKFWVKEEPRGLQMHIFCVEPSRDGLSRVKNGKLEIGTETPSL
jgi:hypothetical protein